MGERTPIEANRLVHIRFRVLWELRPNIQTVENFPRTGL
jgi:hypothetical protein